MNIVNKFPSTGGYTFQNFQGQPSPKLIEAEIPPNLIVPLNDKVSQRALLKKGQPVKAGQIIAEEPGPVSSPAIAPVNGKITNIKEINYFEQDLTAVFIHADGSSEWQSLEGSSLNWKNLSVQTIEKLVYYSGVSSLGSDGIPTRYKSSLLTPDSTNHIIIHAINSEPYNSLLSVLLGEENLPKFTDGLRILNRIMPDAHIHLAIDKYEKQIITALKTRLSDTERLTIYPAPPKYPASQKEVLVPAVVGRRIPFGASPALHGTVVLSIQEVLKVYQAVAEGRPLIDKVIAFCGPGFKQPAHVNVRLGTPIHTFTGLMVEKGQNVRLIANSIANGKTITDSSLPVDSSIDILIAVPEQNQRKFLAFARPGFSTDSYSRTFASRFLPSLKRPETNLHGEPRPCIFCGFCEQVCPFGIIPHLLYRYISAERIEEDLESLRLFRCNQCKLCTYVCPSKIPLADYLKQGQELLIEKGIYSGEPPPDDRTGKKADKTKPKNKAENRID